MMEVASLLHHSKHELSYIFITRSLHNFKTIGPKGYYAEVFQEKSSFFVFLGDGESPPL
jgi:hypothetical protein